MNETTNFDFDAFVEEVTPLFSALYAIGEKYKTPVIAVASTSDDPEHYSIRGSLYVPAESPDRMKMIAALCAGEADIAMAIGDTVVVKMKEQDDEIVPSKKELN